MKRLTQFGQPFDDFGMAARHIAAFFRVVHEVVEFRFLGPDGVTGAAAGTDDPLEKMQLPLPGTNSEHALAEVIVDLRMRAPGTAFESLEMNAPPSHQFKSGRSKRVAMIADMLDNTEWPTHPN